MHKRSVEAIIASAVIAAAIMFGRPPSMGAAGESESGDDPTHISTAEA